MAVVPLKEDYIMGDISYHEYAGLSTDTKPTGGNIATGSMFVEVNTGKVFLYNSAATAGSEWVEQFSLQPS